MITTPVSDASQVAVARRAVMAAAGRAGLGEADAARAALAGTELATNLLGHGGGGELLVEARHGEVTAIALDRGRGMADVQACLRDGYSTAGTPGTGLGAVKRQADDFDIFSAPGLGTAVIARLRAGRRTIPPAAFAIGAVNIPKAGEEVSGDAWDCVAGMTVATLIVADGLGHGPFAAQASQEAVRLFHKAPHLPLPSILEVVHAGLRPTRGAAVAVTRIDLADGAVAFGGIGNIGGMLLADGKTSRMVSHNGTAGHIAPRMRAFTYAFTGFPLVILCSDGLTTSWSLDRYPGLASHDPALIAAVLYRDHGRGRDDATAVVVQARPR
jgi:anti-sigma regulatory factor (Ser/Thr protein kinase)